MATKRGLNKGKGLSALIDTNDSGKKDEIKPDVTPEPETPEEKMQKADKWVLPIILAITSGIGFLFFLIFKRRKEEKNEAEQ